MKQQRKKGESISACYSPVKHQAMIHKFFFLLLHIRLHRRRSESSVTLKAEVARSLSNVAPQPKSLHRDDSSPWKMLCKRPPWMKSECITSLHDASQRLFLCHKDGAQCLTARRKSARRPIFFSNHQTNFPISSISMAFFSEASFFQATLSLSTAQHITRKKIYTDAS